MCNYYKEREEGYQASAFLLIGSIILAGIIVLVVSCQPAHAEEIDMAKIAQIESSGNPNAWNKRDDSRGLYQITPIVLKEFNRFHPRVGYTKEDLWNTSICEIVADWYISKRIPAMLKTYKIPDSLLNRIASYNWGIGRVRKWHKNGANFDDLPEVTRRYYVRYVQGK